MSVEPAPHGNPYANRLIAHDYGVTTRVTAGSSSVRAFEQPLREAAAVARAMLCKAAADRWGVSAAECDTEGGFIVHESKRLAFGDVSADAAGLRAPDFPQLRAAGAGKLAGELLPRLDLPAKSDGSMRFASDVRLPRMIFASVRMAPPGGRLAGFSREGAKRQPGLIDLVVHDRWLAALGETWWAADHALTRAAPRFTGPEAGDINAALSRALRAGKTDRLYERGDYAAATEGSSPLAATYSIAATPHRSLEAPAAVARFTGDKLEVWAGTQIPDLARTAAAKAANFAEHAVTIYPCRSATGRVARSTWRRSDRRRAGKTCRPAGQPGMASGRGAEPGCGSRHDARPNDCTACEATGQLPPGREVRGDAGP
jgi:isoquinoline 1-oxidoreductase beta subunit